MSSPFRPSGIDWDWDTKTGRPYLYSTFGADCSEVQIDCLTGSHKLVRTDMVMDVGKSLNPAIDIGQVRPRPSCVRDRGVCRLCSNSNFASTFELSQLPRDLMIYNYYN